MTQIPIRSITKWTSVLLDRSIARANNTNFDELLAHLHVTSVKFFGERSRRTKRSHPVPLLHDLTSPLINIHRRVNPSAAVKKKEKIAPGIYRLARSQIPGIVQLSVPLLPRLSRKLTATVAHRGRRFGRRDRNSGATTCDAFITRSEAGGKGGCDSRALGNQFHPPSFILRSVISTELGNGGEFRVEDGSTPSSLLPGVSRIGTRARHAPLLAFRLFKAAINVRRNPEREGGTVTILGVDPPRRLHARFHRRSFAHRERLDRKPGVVGVIARAAH